MTSAELRRSASRTTAASAGTVEALLGALTTCRPTMSSMISSMVVEAVSSVPTRMPSRSTVMRSEMSMISCMRWET